MKSFDDKPSINFPSRDVQELCDLSLSVQLSSTFASQDRDQSFPSLAFGSTSPRRKRGDNWCCVVTECQITFEEVFDHGLSFESTF
ncbi:uncharacterized [Tachysurus ichikawai]